MRKKPTIIDLFAGAGGMTSGFVDAGFKPVLAVEREPDFAATYAENFGKHIIADDIVEFCKTAEISKVQVVVGAPPLNLEISNIL